MQLRCAQHERDSSVQPCSPVLALPRTPGVTPWGGHDTKEAQGGQDHGTKEAHGGEDHGTKEAQGGQDHGTDRGRLDK